VLFLAALVRGFAAAKLPLVEDEAYYWEWSRHLDFGYFDHPPGIAWLIALGAPFGQTEFGVRAGPWLAGIFSVALLAGRARNPFLFLLLVCGVPLYALGGVLATPDVPLLAGWSVALWALLGKRWIWLGFGIGLAGLGKYTGWGFFPLAGVAVAADAWVHRRRFDSGVLWAGLVAIVVLLPNLWWNAAREWSSVGFQLGHGLNRPPAGALAFFGAQIGLAGPVFFVTGMLWSASVALRWLRALRGRGEAPRFDELVAAVLSAPIVLFFTFAATRGSGEANWAAPAYLAMALGLSGAAGRWERATWVAAGTGILLSGIVFIHLARPLVSIPGDPTARLGLGRDLARSVQAWGIRPVYTTRYQEAAMIAFYGGVEAYALPGVDRADQYDAWPIRWATPALFVRPFRGGPSTVADPFCADRSGPNVVSEYNAQGEPLARWQVYEVYDCKPKEIP
jgi:4-amino-4-deoxy-L-arabinose transferase-like glycosyltransferase